MSRTQHTTSRHRRQHGYSVARPDRSPRRGSVLLIVTVVLLLLTLAAYTFSDLMVTEYETSTLSARGAKTRAYADSGVEIVATILSNRLDMTENIYNDPTRFQILMESSESLRGNGRVSIVAPMSANGTGGLIRYGLMNESAKLSIEFAASREDLEEGHLMMMMIPGMTDEVADILLDWFDEDSEPRDFGAEIDDYGDTGLIPADGQPMHSLDELLMIPGVTPALLYGEDANRNGLLDPDEDDGENGPFDNADGFLDQGWSVYLTVHGRESNLALDGSEKLFINDSSVTDLYEELIEVLEEAEAEFIAAYLLFGPSNFDKLSDTDQAAVDAGLEIDEQAQLEEAASQIAQGLLGGGDSSVTVGPNEIDASGGKQFTINSFFELIDAEIEAVDSNGSMVTISSPWSSAGGSMDSYLPTMLDLLTTTEDTVIRGRIDVNQARYEVLMAIPEMDDATAQAIVSAQLGNSDGQSMDEVPPSRATHGWLWSEGVLDRETFLQFEEFMTAGGDVYRAQIIGHFDEGGPQSRVEALIDSSEYPSRILFVRDLSYLGPAYPNSMLIQQQTP